MELVGIFGGLFAIGTRPVIEWLRIDDPVGSVAMNLIPAIWGTLVVGLIGSEEFAFLTQHQGSIICNKTQ